MRLSIQGGKCSVWLAFGVMSNCREKGPSPRGQIQPNYGDSELVSNLQIRQINAKEGGVTSVRISSPAPESVRTDYLRPGFALPLVITPAADGVELMAWARNNRESLEACLLQEGAILFRNFDLHTAEEFEQLIKTVSGKLLTTRTDRRRALW